MAHSSALKELSYFSRLKWVFAGCLVCALLISGCGTRETQAPTLTPKPKEVDVIKDLPYYPDGAEYHLLDLYLPAGKEGPFPTLLMIHGGSGKKEDLVILGQTFARKGFAAVSIDHRQWPDYSYPDHVEDAFCSLAWITANQETYNFDPNAVFVMGHSAGGTLAALLGTINDPTPYLKECPHTLPGSDWVKGVIPFTGIFDYTSAADDSPSLEEYAVDLLGGTREDIPLIWEEASAASWVDGNDPPFLLIHGEDDQNISPQQSVDFAALIKEKGGIVDLLLIEGASHNQIKSSSQSIEAVENFITNILH